MLALVGLVLAGCDSSGSAPSEPAATASSSSTPQTASVARAAMRPEAPITTANFGQHSFSDFLGSYLFTSAGSGFSCGFTVSGDLYCWGSNASGQLGAGTDTLALSTAPVQVEEPAGARLFRPVTGGAHACAVSFDGDVYCWGENAQGQLGDGTTTNRSAPVQVAAPAGASFHEVVAGFTHSCALTKDGDVYCWGDNAFDQLGNASTAQQSATPVQLTLPDSVDFARIAANEGAAHTCGVATDGAIYCWGFNGSGQLGDGTTTSRDDPTLVAGSGSDGGQQYFAVSPGFSHTCALGFDGAARCWGDNSQGQLGIGAEGGTETTPVAVAGNEGPFFQIGAGSFHSAAVGVDGKALAWGSDGDGEVGNGAGSGGVISAPEPVAQGGARYRGLEVGFNHNGAVALLGRAFSWGSNSSGELGIGEVGSPRFAPVQVLPPEGNASTDQPAVVSSLQTATVTANASGGDLQAERQRWCDTVPERYRAQISVCR